MAKGGAFEREICKKFSLWWTEQMRDDIFWRTAGSGGRATARAKKGKTTEGQHLDMASTDSCSKPFTDVCAVEAKSGYTGTCSRCMDALSILDHQPNRKTPVTFEEFWERSAAVSGDLMKEPLLVFRRTGRPPLIAMRGEFFSKLGEWSSICRCDCIKVSWSSLVAILRLGDFFEHVTPGGFMAAAGHPLKGKGKSKGSGADAPPRLSQMPKTRDIGGRVGG